MKVQQPGVWVIASGDIAQAIVQLDRLGGCTPGPAIWRCRQDAVAIEWKGGRHEVSAQGPDRVLAFRVPATSMSALAGCAVGDGTFTIAARGESVSLESMSLPLVLVDHTLPTDLLGVRSGSLEVLLAAQRHSGVVVANAGLEEAVAAAEDELRRAAARVATELRWLRVGEEDVERWLRGHVQSLARRGSGSASVARPLPAVPG